MTVVPFRALAGGDVELVGGKSANLGELLQAGFPVPPGFAVTTVPFAEIVQPRSDELLAGLDPEDIGELERRAEEARRSVEALDVPDEIGAAIAEGYATLAEELERLRGLVEHQGVAGLFRTLGRPAPRETVVVPGRHSQSVYDLVIDAN